MLSSCTSVISTDSFNVTLVHEDSNYNPGHKVVLATTSVLLIQPSSDKGYDLFQRLPVEILPDIRIGSKAELIGNWIGENIFFAI